MKLDEIIKKLQKSRLKILTIRDLKKLFETGKDNTAYKSAENLTKKEILIRLKRGLYYFAFSPPDDFEIANYLYSPSYVSLESALSFYGILSQFPYTVTSITSRKTKKFESQQKEFEYAHVKRELFFGYEKEKGFLIALPEKALIDMIYLVSKGLRKIDVSEIDYSKLNKAILKNMARKIDYPPFRKLWKGLKL